MAVTKLNQEEVERLYLEGNSLDTVAKLLGCTRNAVWKRLKAKKLNRPCFTVWNTENDNELTNLYKSGLGYHRCSQHFGVSVTTIQHACKRLGVNDPTRVFTKIHGSSKERVGKRRPFEFSKATKTLRFEQEKGVCQWCHETIDNKFRATYHHIQLIDVGGDGSPQNCMVLHRKCHIDNFEILHNGLKWKHILASKKPTITPERTKCAVCSNLKQYIFNKSTCIDCWVTTLKHKIFHGNLTEIATEIGCSIKNLNRSRKRLGLKPLTHKNKSSTVR